jgi:hypothetical protein
MVMLHKISVLRHKISPLPSPFLALSLFILVVNLFHFLIIVETFGGIRCHYGGKLGFGVGFAMK